MDGTCCAASAFQYSKRHIMRVMSAYLDNSGIKNRQPNRECLMQNYPPQVRTPKAPTRSQLSDEGAAYANSTMDIIPDSSASVNAPSGDLIQMAPFIYRSGSPLFAGMDEAELTSEIAREGRMFFAVTYVLYQTVKKPLESSAGLAALSTLIAPSDMCGGRVDIFASGNPISQSKNIFLAVSTPGNPQDFSGN